jgi:hypothetical protein
MLMPRATRRWAPRPPRSAGCACTHDAPCDTLGASHSFSARNPLELRRRSWREVAEALQIDGYRGRTIRSIPRPLVASAHRAPAAACRARMRCCGSLRPRSPGAHLRPPTAVQRCPHRLGCHVAARVAMCALATARCAIHRAARSVRIGQPCSEYTCDHPQGALAYTVRLGLRRRRQDAARGRVLPRELPAAVRSAVVQCLVPEGTGEYCA